MIEKVKSLIFIGIPYLMFCSAIYQITFWGDFNLNGLEIVSLEDVIKTSIFPFAKTFYESFLFVVILSFVFSFNKKKKESKDEKVLEHDDIEELPGQESRISSTRLEELKEKSDKSFLAGIQYHFLKVIVVYTNIFNRKFFILLLMLILIPLILNYEFKAKWHILFLIITLPISWLISSSIFFKDNKNNWNVFGIALVLIAFPVFSFISGKSEANKILMGYDYNYIIRPYEYLDGSIGQYDTLKIIGFSGDLSVFVGSHNKKRYFVETSAIGPLKHFKKKSPIEILQ